jgi:Tfp pilus assembly protein PilV
MAPENNNASSSRRQHEGGYSLAEALIAALVLAIVLLAIYMVYDTAQQDYARGVARADVQQSIRVALESMARELRAAGHNPSTTACANPLSGAVTALSSSPVSVTFQTDVDSDTCTDQVIYTFVPPSNGTQPCDASDPTTVGRVTRSTQAWNGTGWNPPTPTAYDVAQCVTSLTMTYYDSSGATTTSPANVRRINIAIVGTENIRGFGTHTYTLTSDVRLRNL